MGWQDAQATTIEVDVRDTVEYLAGLTTRELVRLLSRYRGIHAVRALLPAERARYQRIEQVLQTRNGGDR